MSLDGVDAMAISTDRSLSISPGDSLPMDALHEFLFDVFVTLRTCLRNIEFEDGRFSIAGLQNFV